MPGMRSASGAVVPARRNERDCQSLILSDSTEVVISRVICATGKEDPTGTSVCSSCIPLSAFCFDIEDRAACQDESKRDTESSRLKKEQPI